MRLNSYKETLNWLFEQFPSYQLIGSDAYKPDLGNVTRLTENLGHPEKLLNFIHIAGTNGKGSTSSMLASILTESQEKVGLFTSPHIVDFRERIRINGEMISEEEVIDFCNKIIQTDLSFKPSFFEITFAMALTYFAKKKCTICVIETGLGGRLDATNIITPVVSVITNIGVEHTQFLGHTLESIATEKAGIIKTNVPVVIGESTSDTKPVFEKVARRNNSKIIWCENRSFKNKFEVPLLGEYQKNNFRTVLCTLEELKPLGFKITDEVISQGLKNLHQNSGLFGRMQIINSSPLTILDVSHNLDGIKKTLESIKKINKGKLHLIYGSSSDKNYMEIINLFPKNAELNLCTFSNSRSLNFEEMWELSSEMTPKPKIYASVKEAIRDVQHTANEEDTILVFGSFFLISDFF